MTDLTTADAVEPKSTTLDPNTPAAPSGGGAVTPPVDEPAKEPASLRDVIADETRKDAEPKEADADEAADADAKEDGKAKDEKVKSDDADKPAAKDKAADKPADDVKPARDRETDGKFKAKDTADNDDGEKPGHYQAPAKFLPDAREKWLNVPKAVQRDVDNMAREYEAEVTTLRQATQRYDALREFDELAHSNGRDLRESLVKLNEIENLMQANPYAGLNAILQEIGPRKPDGTTPTLYEVAQFITQAGPERWQQIVGARPQAVNDQPRENPEVQALKQRIAQMEVQQTAASVIEPFKAANPRYEELKAPIAKILNSGMIAASLSPSDRLAAAYDMAERLYPPSDVAKPATATSPDADGRADDFSGTKSIKSAPGSTSPDLAPERGGSIRELLSDEMRRKRAS